MPARIYFSLRHKSGHKNVMHLAESHDQCLGWDIFGVQKVKTVRCAPTSSNLKGYGKQMIKHPSISAPLQSQFS